MITIGNVVEVCEVLAEASSKLTMIVGQEVQLRLVTPELPGLEFNQQVIVRMDREIMVHTILKVVCEQFMISVAGLRGPGRYQTICDARKVAASLLTKYVVDTTEHQVAAILKMSRENAHNCIHEAESLLTVNSPFLFQYNQVLKRLKKAIETND